MGMLAEWFVKLTVRGAEAAHKDVDKMGEKLKKAEERAKAFEQGVRNSFTVAAAGVLGLVRAGLAGTVQGEELGKSFTEFAQQVAGVFMPVIELFTGAIEWLTEWMKKLSGDGQVAVLALGAAIATAVAIATGGFSAIFAAIVLVIATIKEFLEQAGVWDGLVAKLKEVGEVILSYLVKPFQWALQIVRNIAEALGITVSKGTGGRARKDVSPTAQGQFNDPAQFFKDLQIASVGQASLPARQLKVAEDQLAETKDLRRDIARLQPAVGR